MFFGYTSIKDFLLTVLGLKTTNQFVLNLGITALAGLASLSEFITNWIWTDGKAALILFIVLLADWITGTIRGTKEYGFSTIKFLRIFPTVAIHGLILMATQSAFAEGIATIIFGGLVGISLISAVGNASYLGWVSGDVKKFLDSHVDKHKTKV